MRAVPGERPHPREQAFRAILERSGRTVDERLVVPYEDCEDLRCRATLEQLLSLSPAPTRLFTYDSIALIVLKHLAEMGIKVPQELSVIGFDNVRLTNTCPWRLLPWTSRRWKWDGARPSFCSTASKSDTPARRGQKRSNRA